MDIRGFQCKSSSVVKPSKEGEYFMTFITDS